jgi:peroxiredoxin
VQLVQLQAKQKELTAAGIQVVGISYDSVDVLKEFADKRKVTFPLLSDPDSKTIKAYGLFDTAAKGKQEGIPYPGTFVVDRDGVIRAKLFHEGPLKRHTPEELIRAAKEVK